MENDGGHEEEPRFVFSPEALAKQRLSEIAESFCSGVKVRSNRYRARVYPQSFIGSEAVSFLVNSSCAPSRKAAVEMGRRLQDELKLFRHVKKEHLFQDDNLFYVFIDEDHSDTYSSRSTSSDFSSCTAQSLLPIATIAEMVQKGVKAKDRRYHLKTYEGCFIGSEAVDFLVGSNLAYSRVAAVDLGRKLRREFNLFEHVVDPTKSFKDEYLFYRFLNKNKQVDKAQLLFENMDIKGLIAMAICFEEGIEMGENRSGRRIYKDTFFGSDAVDYIVANFRFMVNSRHAAVHFVRRITSEFNIVELVTNDYEFKDCDKSLYFFTRPEVRANGMFFARQPEKKQLLSKNESAKAFWDSVCEAISEIPRVSEFEIQTDDADWSKRLKAFEMRCSRRISFDQTFARHHDNEIPTSLSDKAKRWPSSLTQADPRYQILSFFNQVAQEGAKEEDDKDTENYLCKRPLLWYLPNKSSVFTVWRPTSLDSIRRMMLGEAVGKGLDIKGKSAKRGKLSSFVPFLQISENQDKKYVRTLSKDGVIGLFFSKGARRARDLVVEKLEAVAEEMMETVQVAQTILESDKHSQAAFMEAYESMLLDMKDPVLRILDDYAPERYGIELPERLFWETYVVRQDISRQKGCQYCTGRPSQSAFQDLNLSSLRNIPEPGQRRTVVYQHAEPDSPMSPFELLMAYEEHGRVLPVCSDFDSLLMATRRVDFSTPLPQDQVEMLRWMIAGIETILDNQKEEEEDWTQNWIDILRKATKEGFHPDIPRYGFGDAKSYSIMKQATESVSMSGAVRHVAECFNFYWPQKLDEEFLVISDDLPGTNLQWKYVDEAGLQDILMKKIDQEYTFPLNPKWILADHPNWKTIYDKMLASKHPNIRNSMDVWFPPDSGIREEIEHVHKKHPDGFYGARC